MAMLREYWAVARHVVADVKVDWGDIEVLALFILAKFFNGDCSVASLVAIVVDDPTSMVFWLSQEPGKPPIFP
jgi:hypothetical protein